MEPDQLDVQEMPARRSGKWYILGAVLIVILIAAGALLYYYKGGFGNIGMIAKPQTVSGTATFILSNPVTSSNAGATGLTSVYFASGTEMSLPFTPPKGAAIPLGGVTSGDQAQLALVYQTGMPVNGVPTSIIVRVPRHTMKPTVTAQSATGALIVAPVLNFDGSLLAYGSIVPNGAAKTIVVLASGKTQELANMAPVAFAPDSSALLVRTQNGLSIHPLNGGADMPVALPSNILLGKDVNIGSVSPDGSRFTVQSAAGVDVISINWSTGAAADVYSVTANDTKGSAFDPENNLLVVSKSGTVVSYDATGKKTGTATIQVPNQFSVLDWLNPVSAKKS